MLFVMLTVIYAMLNDICAECHKSALYAECRYAEFRYAECRGTLLNHSSIARAVLLEQFCTKKIV
jgi:hypothetical protein